LALYEVTKPHEPWGAVDSRIAHIIPAYKAFFSVSTNTSKRETPNTKERQSMSEGSGVAKAREQSNRSFFDRFAGAPSS
jgi:hypothetical protein